MPAIGTPVLLIVVAVALAHFVCLDWVKVLLFARLKLR